MTEQAQFRYVSLAVGGFVLATLLLTAVVVFQAARAQKWFREDTEVIVQLPVAGSFGLEAGGKVVLLGTEVGRVREIRITPDGDMIAEISVDADYLPFVRIDSAVYIKKQFGVAGDAYLQISRGKGAPFDPTTSMLTAAADESPTELLGVVMDEVRRELLPMVRDARAGIQAGVRLADSLEQPVRDLNTLVVTLNRVVADLERGKGTLGQLLVDDGIARELGRTTAELSAASARVGPLLDKVTPVVEGLDQTMRALRELLGQLSVAAGTLPSTARSVDRVAADLPALMLETQATLRETQRFLQRLQQHWLFGGTAGAIPLPTERIPAAEAAP